MQPEKYSFNVYFCTWILNFSSTAMGFSRFRATFFFFFDHVKWPVAVGRSICSDDSWGWGFSRTSTDPNQKRPTKFAPPIHAGLMVVVYPCFWARRRLRGWWEATKKNTRENPYFSCCWLEIIGILISWFMKESPPKKLGRISSPKKYPNQAGARTFQCFAQTSTNDAGSIASQWLGPDPQSLAGKPNKKRVVLKFFLFCKMDVATTLYIHVYI